MIHRDAKDDVRLAEARSSDAARIGVSIAGQSVHSERREIVRGHVSNGRNIQRARVTERLSIYFCAIARAIALAGLFSRHLASR